LRFAEVIVKNKLPRFLWFTVYIHIYTRLCVCMCVADESSDCGEMHRDHYWVWTFTTGPTTCSAWYWWYNTLWSSSSLLCLSRPALMR